MPFFSPMPKEAITFYEQGPLKDRNITIDRFPVGTGAYRLDVIDPHKEIVLKRNEHFHTELYPSSDSASEDGKLGLTFTPHLTPALSTQPPTPSPLPKGGRGVVGKGDLWRGRGGQGGVGEVDIGKRLPFIDTAVYKLEKEFIPRWNKFLQGYYDVSGISSDTFDRAIQFTDQGNPQVSEVLTARSIRLLTNVETSTYYLAFNMLDDVVGGYTEEKRKLRQAISIAMDYEEYIEIFTNGCGIPSYSPIPPGIFGYEEGEKGINPYVYDFSMERGAVRKSLDEARRLLAEAGYQGGKDTKGNPLIIYFDNAWVGAGATAQLSWMRKKLEAIGITMVSRTTDYNRFQDKVHSGNFQLLSWGWLADYPDPENFLFLLYGPNSMAESDGENVANYRNSQYDRLFEQMRSMENSPQRLAIIREMKQILQRDAPWVFTYHPVDFGLYHQWVRNAKPSNMANNTLKYLSVDSTLREDDRQEWNRPVLWPIATVLALLFVFTIPATITIWRRERGRGKGAKGQEG
jgi:ABC-type oligopeptide transport system substrate-binding subunit